MIMESFALRVASKRQVTIPTRLLELLNIGEGDVLELTVESGSVTGRGMKLVPSSLFTPKILEELNKRQKELDTDSGIEIRDLERLGAKLLR